MSPPRETSTVDASKLSFPLQVVIIILSAFAAMWASTYGLRSDVRDILTRMEMQAKLDERDTRILQERYDAIKEDVAALTREDRMRQFELKAIETRLTAIEPKGKRP